MGRKKPPFAPELRHRMIELVKAVKAGRALNHTKSKVRAKVEHPIGVLKRNRCSAPTFRHGL